MFTGSYEHSVDVKGRIIIPSKLRDGLGDTFIITKGVDGCLLIYPMEEWENFVLDLKKLPSNKEGRMLQRYFLASAIETEFDKQGRALLPQNLREHANINKNVLLVGLMNKIEIWDVDVWSKNTGEKNIEEVFDEMTEYGIRF